MNPSIKKLAVAAEKRTRSIIGLMSGTSLDGLDIALCEISGSGMETAATVKRFVTVSYTESVRERLRKITSVEQTEYRELCHTHSWLGEYHAELILEALKKWNTSPSGIDCIASHGQTVYHFPGTEGRIHSTLQIGDGDHIAARTGILTLSDFRQKHTAYGGEGAPMAGFADRILFTHRTRLRILLNIGGIANYTVLPPENAPVSKPFTTDTGPGNTLIDSQMQKLYQHPFDHGGKTAAAGRVNKELLIVLMQDSFFKEKGTKSTGPEYFNEEWIGVLASSADIELSNIGKADLIATLTELSAVSITKNIVEHVAPEEKPEIFVSGGGVHNAFLMDRIRAYLPGYEVKDFSGLGVNPDAKEALVFAVLANEMLAGEGFDVESANGPARRVNFGKISFPF